MTDALDTLLSFLTWGLYNFFQSHFLRWLFWKSLVQKKTRHALFFTLDWTVKLLATIATDGVAVLVRHNKKPNNRVRRMKCVLRSEMVEWRLSKKKKKLSNLLPHDTVLVLSTMSRHTQLIIRIYLVSTTWAFLVHQTTFLPPKPPSSITFRVVDC